MALSVLVHVILFVSIRSNNHDVVRQLNETFIDIQLDEEPIPDQIPISLPNEQKNEIKTEEAKEQQEKPSENSDISDELAEQVDVDTSVREENPLSLSLPTLQAGGEGTGQIETLGDAGELDNPDFKPYGNLKPPYPEVARQLGIEGFVRLQVLVGPSGRVEQIKVLDAKGHPSFAEAAKTTAIKWRFAPPHQMGIPVRLWYEQKVEFRLRE